MIKQIPEHLDERVNVPPPKLHLDYLDGVRAFAAGWVVLGHLWALHTYYPRSGIFGLATNWLLFAHLAVDLFIVLSGFCLIIPVARRNSIPGGALGFFKRRARRILPPYYVALLAALVLALLINHLGRHHQPGTAPRDLLMCALLLQDIPTVHSVNAVFWSIAVEWKIYFLFPAIVWLINRSGTLAALAGAAFTACVFTTLVHAFWPHSRMLYTCPWYVMLFTMGACGGLAAFRPPKVDRSENRVDISWLAAFVVSSLFVLIMTIKFSGLAPNRVAMVNQRDAITDILAGIACTTFLYLLSRPAAANPFNGVKRLLESRPVVFIGTYAYSIYLTHLPVLFVTRIAVDQVYRDKSHPFVTLAMIGLIGLPLTLSLGYLFFLAFELPFLNSKSQRQVTTAEQVALSPAP